MIYGLIVGTRPDSKEYMNLSYEDLLRAAIDHLLSNEQQPLTFWRRCCSSVHTQTMSVETCNEIRRITGVSENKNRERVERDLDNAINNWYLKGKISLSEDDLIRPEEDCRL